MNSVERVKQLCKEREIPLYRLEKELGFSNGYIGQLRKGVFPDDRLLAIAKYLDVSAAELMGADEQEKAPVPKKDKRSALINEIMKYVEKMSPEYQKIALAQMKALWQSAENP